MGLHMWCCGGGICVFLPHNTIFLVWWGRKTWIPPPWHQRWGKSLLFDACQIKIWVFERFSYIDIWIEFSNFDMWLFPPSTHHYMWKRSQIIVLLRQKNRKSGGFCAVGTFWTCPWVWYIFRVMRNRILQQFFEILKFYPPASSLLWAGLSL